jgi:predicted short-subunit dehydrogenase-like oxidoreductase (DUF2520 family)
MRQHQPDKILIVGTGGVALTFASAFVKSKIYDVIIEGSDSKKTDEFCKNNKFNTFNKLDNKKDIIVFLAVPDSQIENCVIKYSGVAKLIVHFSGTSSIETITKHAKNGAVCWPIESFSKLKKANLSKVICGINTSNEFSKQLLLGLIDSIKLKHIFLNDEERMKLHLTAVILNNFIYYLLSETKKWIKNENINNLILKDLFNKTISSFYNNEDTGENQTGPAKRNDQIIIKQHLELLKNYPELETLYKSFTDLIIEKYNN